MTHIRHESMEVIMATALGDRTQGRVAIEENCSDLRQVSICTRCGGLMVSDFCMDLLNSTGELVFAAKRCVQCGDFVDPVILQNRRLQQELSVR